MDPAKHEHNQKCMLRVIRTAKRNIDITMNFVNSPELNKALIDAHKSGINVRILCETDYIFTNMLELSEFYMNGCYVRFLEKNDIENHKLCIIDKPREDYIDFNKPEAIDTILIIGTKIGTVEDSLFNGFDNIDNISYYQLICKYQEYFDTMWKD